MKPVLTTAAYDLPLPVTSSLLGGTLDRLLFLGTLMTGSDRTGSGWTGLRWTDTGLGSADTAGLAGLVGLA